MKKIIFGGLFILFALSSQAQDEAVFTHFYANKMVVNPAAAAYEDQHQVGVQTRLQWTGFPDAPKTFSGFYQGPLSQTVGLGLTITNERLSQLSRMRTQLNMAFHFPLNDRFELSAGVGAEFRQVRLSQGIMDSRIDEGDETLLNAMDGKNSLDASLGFFGTIDKNTYFGFSINNLVQSRLDDIVTNEDGFNAHFTVFAGHKFKLKNIDATIEPGVLFRKIMNSPTQTDLAIRMGFFGEQLITGVSYRSIGAVGMLVGTRINSLLFNYSYDIGYQEVAKYENGTHELSLIFNIPKSSKKRNTSDNL